MKKKWIYALVAIVLIGLVLLVPSFQKKVEMEGKKEISVEIVDEKNKAVLDKMYHTDAKNLAQFVEEEKDLKAKVEDGEYGAFLTEIYGLKQDMDKGPWIVYESGNNKVCKEAGMCPAMDDVALEDGDSFTIKLVTSFE